METEYPSYAPESMMNTTTTTSSNDSSGYGMFNTLFDNNGGYSGPGNTPAQHPWTVLGGCDDRSRLYPYGDEKLPEQYAAEKFDSLNIVNVLDEEAAKYKKVLYDVKNVEFGRDYENKFGCRCIPVKGYKVDNGNRVVECVLETPPMTIKFINHKDKTGPVTSVAADFGDIRVCTDNKLRSFHAGMVRTDHFVYHNIATRLYSASGGLHLSKFYGLTRCPVKQTTNVVYDPKLSLKVLNNINVKVFGKDDANRWTLVPGGIEQLRTGMKCRFLYRWEKMTISSSGLNYSLALLQVMIINEETAPPNNYREPSDVCQFAE